jgi:IS66 Orf2 like protein
MRRGMQGLAALVETVLATNPCCGHVFAFRGRMKNRYMLIITALLAGTAGGALGAHDTALRGDASPLVRVEPGGRASEVPLTGTGNWG